MPRDMDEAQLLLLVHFAALAHAAPHLALELVLLVIDYNNADFAADELLLDKPNMNEADQETVRLAARFVLFICQHRPVPTKDEYVN